MWPKLLFCIFLIVFPVAIVVGQDDGPIGPVDPGAKVPAAMANNSGDPDAKMVSGMSILGNKEAPMSLFIVPWKTSELGAETNLTRTLNERRMPVDREVFLREIAFYEVGAGSKGSSPAAVPQLFKSR
ncbi:MAG TPA: hypothetical protein DCZ75_18560 [Geobacter sp.]|nr:hypothetical protein [Geobacter sp.]